MNSLLTEKAGRGTSQFDVKANRLRQQKEDLLGIATEKAGNVQQDLLSKVDKYTAPVAQTMTTIGHGKQAIQNIRKSALVRRIQGQTTSQTDKPPSSARGANAIPDPDTSADLDLPKATLSQADAPAVAPVPRTPAPPSLQARATNLPRAGTTDDGANPFSFSNPSNSTLGQMDANAKPTISSAQLPSFQDLGIKAPATSGGGSGGTLTRLDPMAMADRSSRATFGGFSGTQAGDDASEFAKGLSQGTRVMKNTPLNVSSMVNNASNKISTRLGTTINFNKPPSINPHASMPGMPNMPEKVGFGGVSDDLTSLGGKAKGAVASASEGLDAGLGLAGDIADAFGPVGDLIGIGLSIFGGIEGHEAQKSKESAEDTQQSAVSAPIQSQAPAQIGATLKTQGQQQVSQVHY